MNSTATWVALATVLLAGIAPALAADSDPRPAAQETREQAKSAAREAVEETLERMRADTRVDLSVEPARPEPNPVSAD